MGLEGTLIERIKSCTFLWPLVGRVENVLIPFLNRVRMCSGPLVGRVENVLIPFLTGFECVQDP